MCTRNVHRVLSTNTLDTTAKLIDDECYNNKSVQLKPARNLERLTGCWTWGPGWLSGRLRLSGRRRREDAHRTRISHVSSHGTVCGVCRPGSRRVSGSLQGGVRDP